MDTDWDGLGRIRYVGTAVSHFQAEPIMDDSGLEIKLDWEREVYSNIERKPSCIRTEQRFNELPRLLRKSRLYAARSVEIGMNMFRFSIELGRLSSEIGRFDESLMARYVGFIGLLRSMGQEPMITLQHYAMPLSLVGFRNDGSIRSGAWEHPDVIRHIRYCMEQVLRFLADENRVREAMMQAGVKIEDSERFISEGLVKYFITLNEPIMTVLQGYLSGLYPPFKRLAVMKAVSVFRRMVEAHDLMYSLLKESASGATAPQVGIAHNWSYFDGPLGSLYHKVLNEILYSSRFERTGEHSDFLGLQYYFRMTPPLTGKKWKWREYSDHPGFGDIYPAGIEALLYKMHRAYPHKGIFVTEFGFPDRNDQRRPYWIMETFRHICLAAKNGVPVIGALYWSLADNFEWDHGMDQKFGVFKESELAKPPVHTEGVIRSWETLKACADDALQPSDETLKRLQDCHRLTKMQNLRYSRKVR